MCIEKSKELLTECLRILLHFLISVLANSDLLKLVLECSELVTSLWRCGHPSDTEEDPAVGLSNEDEAAGLGPESRVARHSFEGPASAGAPAPAEVPTTPKVHPTGDEVLVKKRALKWVKQQVSALLHGEDLPEGAQAREVAKVPYQISAVPGKLRTFQCVSSPSRPITA